MVRQAVRVAGAVLLVLLIAGGLVLHSIVTGIARDNLSNRTFWREHHETPATLGLPSSNVTFTSDGLTLRGWWVPAPGHDDLAGPGAAGNGANGTARASPLTAILVHGLGSNMSKVLAQWAPNLHAAGLNVLTFDLRNHGASDDTPGHRVTFGVDESRDVLAAVAFVRANADALGADPDRLLLYGGSMGAVSVLLAAAQQPPGVVGVVADSGYSSFAFQARIDGDEQGYPSLLVSWVVQRMDDLAPSPPTASDARRALGDVAVPLLLAHCTDDTRIQVASFDRLQDRRPDAVTWTGPCVGGKNPDRHVDGYLMPGYNGTVRAFVASLE